LAGIASLCLQNAMNRERLIVNSHTDLLTHWYNRRYLDIRLPQEVARALRYREPLCCLMLDLDHFKRINDRYGHPAGDAVLREVANRIRNQLRSSDLRVRYGGEEFVVFLIRTREEDAASVAERVRRGVAEAPIRLQGEASLRVTLSGGIAELAPGDRSKDPVALGAAMLQRADAALYHAKAAGRDRIVCHGRGEN
jgi:diguanylate cyclase (GGDEF)-like protein